MVVGYPATAWISKGMVRSLTDEEANELMREEQARIDQAEQ